MIVSQNAQYQRPNSHKRQPRWLTCDLTLPPQGTAGKTASTQPHTKSMHVSLKKYQKARSPNWAFSPTCQLSMCLDCLFTFHCEPWLALWRCQSQVTGCTSHQCSRPKSHMVNYICNSKSEHPWAWHTVFHPHLHQTVILVYHCPLPLSTLSGRIIIFREGPAAKWERPFPSQDINGWKDKPNWKPW